MASQKVHGIEIDLDVNTSGINESFKDLNKSINSTTSELKTVEKMLKFDPKNTVLLTQKQSLLSDAIDKTSTKLIELSKAKQKADEDSSVDKTSKAYRDLERDIISTKAKLDQFKSALQDNENALENVGDEAKGLKKTFSGIGDSMDDVSNKTSTFGSVLKANLTSEAIIGGIKAIANGIKEVGSAIVDTVKDTANYADEINTLAKEYNLSTKEIQQYKKASQLIDVEFETIAKSMSKLTKSMTSTSTTTKDAFKTLRVSVKDANGELRDSNEVFNEVIEALGLIENETQQDALALDLFGKSSAELGPLINGGVEQLKDFNKYLEENDLLLSDAELTSANNLQDSFDMFDVIIDSIKQKIGTELVPVVQPLVDGISQFLVDHKDEIIEMVQKVVDYVQTPEFLEIVNEIKDDAISIVSDVGDTLTYIKDIKPALELLKVPLDVIAGIVKAIHDFAEDIHKWRASGDFEFTGNGSYAQQVNARLNGGGGRSFSAGFGASGGFGFQSGGYGTINLNASFVANGNLDETQARRFASLMVDQINEELGMKM